METIYICEDDPQQIACLEQTVQDYIAFHCENNLPKIASFTDPYKLLSHIQEKNKFSVYLLDIALNSQINGIQLADRIRKLDPLGFIIFITCHDEYMPLTFRHRVGALDYIAKDSDDFKSRVMQALQMAYDRFRTSMLSQEENNYPASFCLQNGATLHHIYYRDILYIKTVKEHRIRIFTCSGYIEYYGSLKDLQRQLPSDQFFQCHRSAIINIYAIETVNTAKNFVVMKNDITLPLSKYKKDTLIQLLTRHNASQ